MKIELDKFKINNNTQDIIYYTTIGDESFLDEKGYPVTIKESPKVFAKKIKNKKSKKLSGSCGFSFFIKAYGSKKIYDPYIRYSIENRNTPTKIENICKKSDYFLEVNEYIFKKYLNYLKTQNKSWFIETQKDLN